jgi:hypothetical protein
LALVPLLCACPVVEGLLGEGPADDTEEITVDDSDPTLRIDEKLGAYIGCRDSLAGPLSESWARYSVHVDESGKAVRRNRAFIYPVGKASFRICNEVLAEAPERPPPMPEIERSAEQMVEAARTYAELSREVHDYFESRGFEDDDWAKLETLHPRISEAHESWKRSDAVLELYLDTEKATNDPKVLEILSAEERDLEHRTRAVMVHARPLARCFGSADTRDGGCKTELDQFEGAYQAFDQAVASERDAAEKVFWMRAFIEDAGAFHEKANELSRALANGRARAEDEEEALLLYDSLVRDADTLDFDFP